MNRNQRCSSKKNHYPTMEMAEKARKSREREHRWKLDIYLCTECDEYHLTRFKVRGVPVPIVGEFK